MEIFLLKQALVCCLADILFHNVTVYKNKQKNSQQSY